MGIAGFRADLGIIDDPFGSRDDAYSERIRDRVWDWYNDDFSARLKPGAKRVVMATRWHLDDLAGRILEHSAQRVRSVIIPAIAEPGDVLGREPGQYLWDDADGYNYGAFLRSRQLEMADRPVEWSALYQQKPVPEAGGFFKAEWIRYYDQRPTNLRMYGASDYAVTADGGDFTEHGVAGVNTEGDLYVTDWWSGQTTTDVWVDVMLDLYARHETLAWAEESGQIIKSLDPFIVRRCQERGLFPYREQFTSRCGQGGAGAGHQGQDVHGQGVLAAPRAVGDAAGRRSSSRSPPASTTTRST